MYAKVDNYALLVDKLGEAMAYEICEKLGGLEIIIPKKTHKTYRIRKLIKRAIPLIKKDKKKKNRLVKRLARVQNISIYTIYKIISEEEYGK